jgi:hypothetical protein
MKVYDGELPNIMKLQDVKPGVVFRGLGCVTRGEEVDWMRLQDNSPFCTVKVGEDNVLPVVCLHNGVAGRMDKDTLVVVFDM